MTDPCGHPRDYNIHALDGRHTSFPFLPPLPLFNQKMERETLPVPKTTHSLKHDQRTRLIRSTRKVEALLGETPYFIDSAGQRASIIPNPAAGADPLRPRTAYIYTPGPRRSSLEAEEAHPRPVLAVRIPRPPSALRQSNNGEASIDSPLMSAASTSTTFSFSFPLAGTGASDASSGSNASSAGAASAAAAIRRAKARKMAKVTRTLGERVPQELLFPAGAPPTRARRSSRGSAGAYGQSQAPMQAQTPSGPGPRRSNTLLRQAGERRRMSGAAGTGRGRGMSGSFGALSEDVDDSASEYSVLSGGDWALVGASGSASASSASAPLPPGVARALSQRRVRTESAPSAVAPSPAYAPQPAPSASSRSRARSITASSPPNPSPLSRSDSQSRRAGLPANPRVSIPATPAPPSRTSMSPSSAPTPSSPSSAPRRSTSIRHASPSSTSSPPMPPRPSMSSASSAPAVSPRSFIPDPSAPFVSATAPVPGPASAGASSYNSFLDTDPDVPLPPPPGLGFDRGTHRTEKGWSGEWVSTGPGGGMDNMDDVAKRLRAMKVK
ncbi:hypothetical protein MKEN_00971000 [Mycena kentingensis (nom. inval.)]|nr:hypothetical protein MKEN_00971000 [Mycena kentingensis (nom. inval.)]